MVSEKVSEKVAAPGRVKWPGAPEGETTQTSSEVSQWLCERAGSPGERDIATLVEGSPWPCEMAGSPGERDIATLAEGSPWPCEMAGSPGERRHRPRRRSANGYVKGLAWDTKAPY